MWMEQESIDKLNRDVERIGKECAKNANTIGDWVAKELTYGGNEIRNTILRSMRGTQTGYRMYKRATKSGNIKIHYSSYPYNPPAIDFGHLLKSIMYDVGDLWMRVGSEAHEAPHGLFMEKGTKWSNTEFIVEPRPWLTPAVDEHIDDINARIGKVSMEIISSPFEGL